MMNNRGASKYQPGTLSAPLKKGLQDDIDDESVREDVITPCFEDESTAHADRDRDRSRKETRSRDRRQVQPVADRGRRPVDSLSSRVNVNPDIASKRYFSSQAHTLLQHD